MVPADASVGILDGPPDGCAGLVVEDVGQRRGQDGNAPWGVWREPAGGGAESADMVVDSGGAGAVQDEQQPREERVAAPTFLSRRLRSHRPTRTGRWRGYVSVGGGCRR